MSECRHVTFYGDHEIDNGIGSGLIYCMDCNKSLHEIQGDLRQQLAAEQAKSAEWREIAANEQYNWGLACDEYRKLDEKVDQQQATIAAMRSVLEDIVDWHMSPCTDNGLILLDELISNAKQALSNTAGAEYSRVKKLGEALRLVLSRYHKLDTDTVKTIHEALGEGKQ